VRHRALVRRKIDLSPIRPAFRGRHNTHVNAGLDLGEQDSLIGDPGEAGGVGQEPRRLAPEHRNSPGIPRA